MNKEIKWIGWDLSTSSLTAIGRTEKGEEVFVSVPMEGKAVLLGQPAHDLDLVPLMMDRVLEKIEAQGFTFAKEGVTCFSVRQHDLALLGHNNNEPVVDALSWEFELDPVAGVEELQNFREKGYESVVGPTDKRFIAVKLKWLINMIPKIAPLIKQVMTTGDAIGYWLTGNAFIGTSDGMSNAILDKNKKLALEVLQGLGFDLSWFPQPIQSGMSVGYIQKPREGDAWNPVKNRLAGWDYRAGSGDNDAGARGSGLDDFVTIVMSFGSSGTVTRIARTLAALAGNALTFEYFHHCLLLNMLEHCANWYDKFVRNNPKASELSYDQLNDLALDVPYKVIKPNEYPNDWNDWTLAQQIATIQKSIAFEMVERAAGMLKEVKDPQAPKIERVIVTGGLKQSPLILRVIKDLLGSFDIYVSALEEPFASQSAARGALITAMMPRWDFGAYGRLAKEMCPIKPLEF
ncbi:MAG: hypothetical protein CEO40_263 [Parcubacteria group bacterium LiPW_72]|nr:MAG: hypothetical protein CEO40_263 [Parcubacteria group bacterium LiPW_72]